MGTGGSGLKKSKQELKARRQLRETGQNIEVIFKAGQKIFPLMDERECCEAILKMSKWKAPRTQAEFFILFKANHEKNLKWARENLEIASLAEDGEISTCVTSNPVVLVDTQGNLIS